VTVREFMPDGETKLADGTTGFVSVDKRVYTIYDHGASSSKRVGNVSTVQAGGLVAAQKRMFAQTDYDIDDFLVDDCNHTFTIGEPESTGVKKYTVTFLENDGSEISAESYKENTDVNVPAAVENELGWANVATGKIVDTVVSGQTITATKNATYKRVLSTDEFDVTINLDGGTVDGESTLVVKAGYGEEVDLTQYAPEKEGYNPVWEPSTVTVDSINGVTAKVKWEAKTFKATFYLNKGDAEAYQVVDIKYLGNLTAPTVKKDGYSFAGWYNAATDELVSKLPTLGQYKVLEDSAYYATWSELPDSITFMVKDFQTGEWKEYNTLYGDGKGTVGTATAPVSVNELKNIKSKIDVAEAFGWDGEVNFARGDKYTSMTFSENYVQSEIIEEAVAYDGAKVIYIHAFPVFEVEFQLPVYDELAGEYTDEYTSETKTVKPTAFTGTVAFSKSAIKAATGYVFDKWVAADGSVADYYDSGANYVFNLSTDMGAKIVVKGSFKLEEYELRFSIGTSDGQTIIPVGINNIGEVLNAETAEFVYATGANKGQATTIPVIGVTGEAQETVVHGKEGYKLVGWYISDENSLIDVTNLEITPELVSKAYTTTEGTKAIIISSKWEAQNYDAKFYYWAEGSTLENPVYAEDPIVISVPVGTGRDNIVKRMSDADLAKLNASVPEGLTLATGWRNEDGTTAANPLPVGGAKYYAIYDKITVAVYVDWNSKEDDSDWYEITGQNVRYGDDTMRGEYNSVDRGVYHYVTSGLSISDLERPTPYHEIVGWKTYHVKDAETRKDTSTWIEGTNDEGTTIVKDTIIYQAQWKHQTDFFFRVYDMSGSLSRALGKDFKMYYWKDSRVVDKDRSEIVTDDTMIIFFFIPKLENFSWDGFFKIDMWKNVSLRFDPFYLPKAMFTWEAFIGLFKAIGTALGTLIKGTD
ncbi:MAG: InlB B-repeat-containing protein, partial [Clostridia bacterium]|nr:InlB B-repeat-containing protein [Clostridia bacterium]